jgi:hypothetical protein
VLPEGALMKLGHVEKEITGQIGSELTIPLTLSRASELREEVKVELIAPELPAGLITAEPFLPKSGAASISPVLRLANDPQLVGEHPLTFRATALKDGKWPVVSETTVLLVVKAK